MRRNIYIKIDGEWKKWHGTIEEAREFLKNR